MNRLCSPQNDGGVVGEFRLSDTEEIKRWILSFGAEAVVVKPDELRREIAAELHTLAAAYREDRPRAKSAK